VTTLYAEDVPPPKRARRGTSNGNARGSSYDVRARKHWLLTAWQAVEGEGLTRCYRCGDLLDWFLLTVDRIVPGCRGGRYVRGNIRPACGTCNSETGGAERGRKRR
jgi:hypothetical protein